MLEKVLKISIPIILILTILLIGYNEYKKVTIESGNPLSIIPVNASIIFEFNEIDKLNQYINSKDIWKKIRNINFLNTAQENIQIISDFFNTNKMVFKRNHLFISLHRTGIEESGILLSTSFINKNHLEEHGILKLIGSVESTYTYDKKAIVKIKLNTEGDFLFCCINEDLLFASTNKTLVEDAIRQSKTQINLSNTKEFQQIYQTTRRGTPINLFYNFNQLINFSSIYTKQESKSTTLNNFLNWTGSDLKIGNNSIIANGFSYIDQNITNYTDILKDSENSKSKIEKYIPKTTQYLIGMSFNDVKNIYDNKNTFLEKKNGLWEWGKRKKEFIEKYQFDYEKFIQSLESEVGVFSCFTNIKRKYVYVKAKSDVLSIGMLQSLFDLKETKEYRNISINKIRGESALISELFGDLLYAENSNYVTSIEDYLFFSNNHVNLEYLIDNYNSSDILANSYNFQNYKKFVSDNANLIFYINPGEISKELVKSLNDEWGKRIIFNEDSILKFTGLSLQLSMRNDYLMNSLTLFYDKDYKEDLKENWSVQLDTSFILSPQIIYNYFTKKEEVLVQDAANKIYLFSPEGDLKWVKKLKSPIIGEVSQLDYYKNKKLQILFNTDHQLHLIDRLGNYVEGYPLQAPEETSLPHSLFDYEKNKEYRIVIIGDDNNIYNLNKKGEKVIGWKYTAENSRIKSNPVHFSHNKKDYIVCLDEDKIKLLARNGSERIAYNTPKGILNNLIHQCNNGDLLGVTLEGKLWTGRLENGESSEITLPNLTSESKLITANLNWKNLSKIDGSSKIIFSSENQIWVLNRNYESLHTKEFPKNIRSIKVFNHKSSSYLCIHSGDKLHIIKDKEEIKGSPIDVKYMYDVSNLDQDEEINILVVKNNFLYNYEFTTYE